jgi:AcrR family transcriptional regulator
VPTAEVNLVVDSHLGLRYGNSSMMPAQVVFEQTPERLDGLRLRKKAKTRLAIEDAALALFAEQGYEATTVEQIADRAEVSTTTFFRYFPSKAEVILTDQAQRLPALEAAIVERPPGEDDLTAVRHAIREAWIATVDPERTARTARAIASSHLLRGISYDIGRGWVASIGNALARRRGLRAPDERGALAARVTMSVFGTSVEQWIAEGCTGDLADAIDRGFDIMEGLCAEWSTGPS